MPLALQFVYRRQDSAPLAEDDGDRRSLIAAMLAAGRENGLVVAGAADTHAHAVARGAKRPDRLAAATQYRVCTARGDGARLEPTRVTAVRDQWHLQNTFFYVLKQAQHHAVGGDPRFEATTLPDMLGLRVIAPWLPARVHAALPRLSRHQLLEILGVDELVPGFDIATLADAAAAAVATRDLSRRTPLVVEARRAAVELGSEHLYDDELAALLGIHPRSIRKLRVRPVRLDLVRAIALQMGLRASGAPGER
ncbi:MAG: hypothetical protein FJ102_24280 [Deltaproteobacteria bacterium]|nr:hypothetical protein [Deltaproteobacteria bacterium]